jgi:hypothetical protein
MARAVSRKTSAEPARRPDMVAILHRCRVAYGVLVMALCVWPALLLAQAPESTKPVLERLDPARRAKVLAAIVGLVILGFGLMALAWMGAKATRRYMNREPVLREKPPTGTPVREKDWTEKPLSSPFEE